MSDQNGAHVTWRELNLALDPIKDDVAEIKGDVKALRGQASNTWLGPKGHGLVGTVVSGVVLAMFTTAISVGVAVLLH